MLNKEVDDNKEESKEKGKRRGSSRKRWKRKRREERGKEGQQMCWEGAFTHKSEQQTKALLM